MAAKDLIAAASDAEFAGRTNVLLFKVAQMVASEDPGTPDHAVRVAYANRVFRGDERPQLVALHMIASNLTIAQNISNDPDELGANVPDGDIEFVLASIWTARAVAFA